MRQTEKKGEFNLNNNKNNNEHKNIRKNEATA